MSAALDRVCVPALRVLLLALGALMAAGSRVLPRFRRQVTRDLRVEISSDDGVLQQFCFHQATRTMTLPRDRAAPDVALRFRSARDGLMTLLSPRAISKVVEGMNAGRTRIDGNGLRVVWFYGLSRVVFPIGRQRLPRRPIPVPSGVPRHDGAWAARIIREPAMDELPREQAAAWRARSRVLQVRVPAGEPTPRG